MKILFLMQLPPPVHGASLVNQSIRNSDFININIESTFIDITSAKNIGDIGQLSIRKIARSILIILKSLLAYLKSKPDVVYLTLSPTGFAFYKDALIALLLKQAGARLVYHLHGKGIKSASKKNRFSSFFYQMVFSGVDVIHLSESLADDIAHLVPAHRIHTVNNGIAHEFRVNRDEMSAPPPLCFLYLSNLVREKGLLDLLTACMQLNQLQNQFEIVIAGRFYGEEFENEFRQKFADAALPNITLLDQGAYGDEKRLLIERCNVMILPTYYPNECFPLTLLEAMSANMAIISTAEGAIADMVTTGENGLIVEKQNPGSIADAMRHFIENPYEAQRMGEAGYKRYCEHFTLEIFERRLVGVLQNIVTRK